MGGVLGVENDRSGPEVGGGGVPVFEAIWLVFWFLAFFAASLGYLGFMVWSAFRGL